jgi:hypothetical protein
MSHHKTARALGTGVAISCGIMGLGGSAVEVIDFGDWRNVEINGGHAKDGHEPSNVCHLCIGEIPTSPLSIASVLSRLVQWSTWSLLLALTLLTLMSRAAYCLYSFNCQAFQRAHLSMDHITLKMAYWKEIVGMIHSH